MRGLPTVLTALASLLTTVPAWAAHAYSQWGEVRYPAGFAQFAYVNPTAPKGGDMVIVSNQRVSNFDKYNPFSLKGTAPAYMQNLIFESLLTGSSDENGTGYGLLASDVAVPADRLSATFRLNPAARFSNGDPVLAADVKHSYDMLISKYAAPAYRSMLEDVKAAVVVDARTIRFDFKRGNRELPLTVGGLPVFSRKWGAGKVFDEITTEAPIASGPYKIGPVAYGRDITYVRDPNYWGRDLNVRRGQFNFDRITVKIYKDNTAKLEGFKAGEFDFNQEFISRDWARAYTGKRFASGELVKRELVHRYPHGFQVHVFNLRLPKYQDIRVRKAITYAYDFEWMNRQLFYGSYKRLKGYFGGGEMEALGTPGPDELALLEPVRNQVRPEVFGPVAYPPSTDPPRSLRQNLREAREMLRQAGWVYRDGALRNAKGEPFVIEYLDSKEGSLRTLAPWVRALEKLGIRFEFRQMDFAIYQERLRKFQFDMTGIRLPGTSSPGNELWDVFGSKAAKQEDSNNLWGIQDPVVDMLIGKLVSAQTKPDAVAAGKALDRVLIHGWYSVPQYYSNTYRVAYDQTKFGLPSQVPDYYEAETWAMTTWWARHR
jgi:microcin C transport system substrate-binding protein